MMTLKERIELQKRLKELTRTSDWMVNPNKRSEVEWLRSYLFPSVFDKQRKRIVTDRFEWASQGVQF
ncbi:hypothetical protein [Enterococcus devriesei]|uniref:hypothetical protein n=2 Tax=Enterococcus devriesei TaxID=319970 RepID=UPI0028F027F4|nr:hypothetical protein [Enterococcus devriesei]